MDSGIVQTTPRRLPPDLAGAIGQKLLVDLGNFLSAQLVTGIHRMRAMARSPTDPDPVLTFQIRMVCRNLLAGLVGPPGVLSTAEIRSRSTKLCAMSSFGLIVLNLEVINGNGRSGRFGDESFEIFLQLFDFGIQCFQFGQCFGVRLEIGIPVLHSGKDGLHGVIIFMRNRIKLVAMATSTA